MFLPEVCIRRPVLASMLSVALVLFGIVGLQRLPVRELPNVDPPVVNVLTVYPGANAEVVETEITEKLEESINSIDGIKSLVSESREQVSAITVEFTQARDIEVSAQDVRDRVARVRGNLPVDVLEPVVAKQTSDAFPFMWIALSSDVRSTRELTDFALNVLKERLQTVPGVSSVFIAGEKKLAMRLWLDPQAMAAHRLTVLDVERALVQENLELPSGVVQNRDRSLTIQTLGQLRDAEEFNDLILRREGDSLVRVRDVGRAVEGVQDEDAVARYCGRPTVGVGVVRQAKANTIEVADGVKRELKRLEPFLPRGVRVDQAYDESDYIREAIAEVWNTLFSSFALVIVTIYVFLRNWRSTLIPTLTIPVAVVATFGLLAVLGFTINIITMLALVLTIGVVVDDSILVLENIYRHVEEGMPPLAAAAQGMREIVWAVIATTVSLVVVFLPMGLQTSLTGRIFVEFAFGLAGAVVISTFIALTLTPMVSARLLRPVQPGAQGRLARVFEQTLDGVTRRYLAWLRWALDHRRAMVGVAVAAMALAALFYADLGHEFMPEDDKGQFLCIALCPEGATSGYTDGVIKKMEAVLASVPEVRGYFSAVALSRGGPGKTNEGLQFVSLKKVRERRVQDLMVGPQGLYARFGAGVPGAIAIPIVPKAIGFTFGQAFQLVVENPDLALLDRTAQAIADRLRSEGFLANVRTNFLRDKPELRVHVDRDRAAALRVSVADLSRTLQILFGGLKISTIKRDGKEYEVIGRLDREERLTPADVEGQYVRSAGGELVQLGSLVRLESGGGPNAIYRYNRMRAATIEGTPMGLPLGAAMERAAPIVAELLPPGSRFEWAGESRDLGETGGELWYVLAVALLVVYITLAAQFESLLHPFTVMLSIPLATLGAFGGLWLLDRVNDLAQGFYGWAHYAPDPPAVATVLATVVPRLPSMTVNVFSQIGLVLLVALVTKSAILLVEFANQRMAEGADAVDAMLEAGRIRLRPVLMTSFSTVMGILPIAIGLGAGGEGRRPLGVVAVGGLLTSTVLTLLLVPVFYVLFDALGRRVRGAPPR